MRRLYPLEISEGEDKTFQLTLVKADGTPYNLTGCTLRSEVRDSEDNLILTIYPTVVNATTGVVNLNIAAATSVGKPGEYEWDLRIESGAGIDYLDASRFRIRRSVTN